MLDLETLIKETAADPDLIELNCFIEDNNLEQILQNCGQEADPPLGHHNGRRSYRDTENTTICSPKRLTFRTSRDKQNVKRCGYILVAKHARRY